MLLAVSVSARKTWRIYENFELSRSEFEALKTEVTNERYCAQKCWSVSDGRSACTTFKWQMMMFMPISWLFFSIFVGSFYLFLSFLARARSYRSGLNNRRRTTAQRTLHICHPAIGSFFVIFVVPHSLVQLFVYLDTPSSISFFLSRAQLFLLHGARRLVDSVSCWFTVVRRSHVTHALRSACVLCSRANENRVKCMKLRQKTGLAIAEASSSNWCPHALRTQ